MSEERFDRIDAGLRKLSVLHEETRDRVKLIAEGLGATNERIVRLEGRMNERFDGVDRRFDGVDHCLHRVEQRLHSVEQRLLSVESTMGALFPKHDARITALEKGR